MASVITQAVTDVVDETNPINAVAIPVFAVIAILITYLPFRSFWRNRNFPAVNLVLILVFQNITWFTNAIIWPDGDWATWYNGTGYCDFLVYTKFPVTTGIAFSLLALMRTLVNALDVDRHSFVDTPAMRRRALLIDVLICWTVPVIQICCYYLVQASRYAIIPVYGCYPVTDSSWLEVLIFFPPVLIASAICTYQAFVIMYRLRQLNADLSRALSTSNSGYTARRYLKLFFIAVFLLVVFLPVECYCFYVSIPKKVNGYSFALNHNPITWNAVVYFPTSAAPVVQYWGWFTIFGCSQIFVFFGFNEESEDIYRKGLVLLGFGLIWPSLKESRETRYLRRRASDSRSSLSSRFDLVALAMRYFDSTSRKNSQVNTIPSSETGQQSRKASHATCDAIALATITSNGSTLVDVDSITPAPTPFNSASKLPAIREPQPIALPPKNRGLLSTWRTHIQLPFPLFISTESSNEEIMRQAGRKETLSNISNHPTSLSTMIWSESFNQSQSTSTSTSRTHASHPSSSTLKSIDDSVDPLSPKLGSRAYRERERREMERDRKEAREAALARKKATCPEGGVIKTTEMNMTEEGPDDRVNE